VSKEAFLVMRDEFPDVFAFQQCILKTEPAIERSRRLDSLISQAKSNYISARSDPHKRIDESSLGLMLSDKLIKLLAQSSNLVDLEVDLYDHIKAIESTLRLREWKELDWPMHLVCISEDGRGGYFALDLSKNKDGDCPVVYFDHELAKIDKKTGRITPQFEVAAKTFSAWIKRLKRGGSAML
jgi:hypothetical protein